MISMDIGLLQSLLLYDSETGLLTWRMRPRSMFSSDRIYRSWNVKWAGFQAFTNINSRGYKTGSIFGKQFQSHRVIWALHYGEWPNGEIDHIDGDKTNNTINNLRQATRSENCRNVRSARNSTSKYLGVFKRDDYWVAEIGGGGPKVKVAGFSTEELAAEEYNRMALERYGPFARLNATR